MANTLVVAIGFATHCPESRSLCDRSLPIAFGAVESREHARERSLPIAFGAVESRGHARERPSCG
ncbi:hypothetical protein SD81_004885 [Tolypothrix campylonemoides VB511288]|nr:hypothetical protein SD81_004885 [Tolypothrix campylonemoides VB511288]